MDEGNYVDRSKKFIQMKEDLKPAEMREKLRDPEFLPTRDFITKAFTTKEYWSEEWWDFCRKGERPVYEFLNNEYLNALAGYLSERINSLGGQMIIQLPYWRWVPVAVDYLIF